MWTWLKEHKLWIVGGVVLLYIVHLISRQAPVDNSNNASGDSTMISGGGIDLSSTGTPATTGSASMADFFTSQTQQAKDAASATKTAALTTTNVDILTTSLNKVGKGQVVNLGYNDVGQVSSISKDAVPVHQLSNKAKAAEEVAIWNTRRAANLTASKLGLPLPFPDVGAPTVVAKK